jgi:hypothetical protein
MCTKKINGGLTGLDERVKLWSRAKAVLLVLPPVDGSSNPNASA